MNARKLSHDLAFVMLAGILLLSACGPAIPATESQPTQTPAQPTEAAADAPGGVSLDYSAVAQNVTVETVAAQPASADAPSWAAGPEYRRLTLEGYPVANHLHKPQVFVYPAGELASANEGMGQMAVDLAALLQTQQVGDHLPFLPLFNAAQVMHAQVEYLDFQNGKGVRFLTQFDQAPLPINNYELFYTFQGLTSDEKYYIAAILPVTHPDLPADDQVNEDLLNDFQGYLTDTAAMLDQQPAESFTPNLNQLDALIRSLDVK